MQEEIKQSLEEYIDDDGSSSLVNQMFNKRSVFITGASGFIGKVLLEKLLRSYQGIKRIYILVRSKKNQDPEERLHKQLLNIPIFDKIRSMKNGDKLLEKIIVVAGDIAQPNLGMSDENVEKILQDETLSIVFHSAATIKFDAPLKVAINLNLIATRRIIELCKRLKNLISLCHVSTAYVNSNILDHSDIDEKLYPINIEPSQLIGVAENLDQETMEILKDHFVDRWPNTYTYAKALAEHLIVKEASGLPVVIVRPSIVGAALKEPLSGWIDNINGATGIVLAVNKGVLRSIYCLREVKADVVPVDLVVNTMIASSFYVAKLKNRIPAAKVGTKNRGKNDVKNESNNQATPLPTPPIVHCVSGDLNPLTWAFMEDNIYPIIKKYPSDDVMRYPFGSFKSNKYYDFFIRLIVHYLPALILDMIRIVFLGKKHQYVSTYYKIHSAVGALSHFMSHSYEFKSRNIKSIQASMSKKDKKELYTSIEEISWPPYWEEYSLGIRRFLLKEPDENLPKARRSLVKLYYFEIGFRFLLLLLLVACCLLLFKHY